MQNETSEKELNPILSQEKARKLLADKEFVDALSKAETNEQIIDLFKTRGVELTLNQVQKIVRQGETLNETDLAKISGGGNGLIDTIKKNPKKTIGAVAATILTVGAAAIGGKYGCDYYNKHHGSSAQNNAANEHGWHIIGQTPTETTIETQNPLQTDVGGIPQKSSTLDDVD